MCTHFDVPAEIWKPLRTTHVLETHQTGPCGLTISFADLIVTDLMSAPYLRR